MRLLVYGGNEHNVRCQIGDWDLSDRGPLLDTYGIPKDGWSIGFGILNEQGFLFLKTSHTAGARIYPFTILFDPGEEIWNKFGWNAAHLALSLLGYDRQSQNELTNNPESYNAQKLEELIQSLKLYEIKSQESKVTYLVAGTIFENDLIAVNPLELDKLPQELDYIAEQIEVLPPYLRTGNGWLFGGSSANAAGLGIKLVFDTNLQTIDREKITQVIQNGNELLQNLRKQGAESQMILARFSQIPSWRWKKTFNLPPTKVLSRLNNLAEMENRSSIADEELEALYGNNEDEFAEVIGQILLKLACKNDGVLTPYRTKFLLERYAEGALPAEVLQPNQFHLDTYHKWLVRNKKFPSESGLSVQLQPFHYFEVCRDIILDESEPKNVPILVNKSIIELLNNNVTQFFNDLVDVVYNKTSNKLTEVWFDITEQDFFKKYLATKFEIEARKLVTNKHKEWINIYLGFANDRGGEWLLKNTPPEQVRTFIAQSIKHLQKFPNSGKATVWLQALLLSPLRNELANEEKITISGLNSELAKSWRNFITLMDLLEGKINSAQKFDLPEEDIYLRNELGEFLQKTPNADLERIKPLIENFFGEIPIEFKKVWSTFQQKANQEVEESRKTTAETQENVNQGELARSSATPTKNELLPFDYKKIANLRMVVKDTCDMMQAALSEQETRDNFIVNFQFESEYLLYAAFPLLPLKTRANILQILYEKRAKDLKSEIQKLFEAGQYNPFAVALWECLLLTDIGAKIKADLNKGYIKDKDFEAKLKEFIEKSVKNEKWSYNRNSPDIEPEKAGQQEEPVRVGDLKGSLKVFFRKYLGWVIFWKKQNK